MSLTAETAARAAGEGRPAAAHDAFQLIADGVTVLGGFGVAAISVARGDDLVVEAVSGSDEAREQLQGTRTTIAATLAEIEAADDWGRFRFLPHDRIDPASDNLGWVPDLTPLDGADAWHPLDLLIAPLRAADGRLLGTLSLDLPGDGRRPGEARRRILDAYAEQAARAVEAALDGEKVAEQLRLADAAREVIRTMSTDLTMEGLLAACNEAMVKGFGAVGLWIQTFDTVRRPGSSRVWAPHGAVIEMPEAIRHIAEIAAHDTWRRGTVDVLVVGADDGLLPPAMRATVDAYLTSLEVTKILFVPLGAGQECVGALILTRGAQDPDWTPIEVMAARDIGRDVGRAVLNARTYERERELVLELQELDTYKGHLIATLSHELKNPLTSILGHVGLLKGMQPDPRVAGSVAAIGRGAERLQRIVESLMTLAKVGDPDHPLIAAPVDLAAVVDDAVDLLSVNAERQGVEVVTEHPSSPVTVMGDTVELDQLVVNLVGNAVKYTGEGGTVTVTLETGEGRVVLSVADTGIGISADDQDRLFTEFFRSNNPEALRQPGTGLGLTIAARIVERHDGEISVTSELGVGTTFQVSLPQARA